MKIIITGVHKPQPLTLAALVGKIWGLLCCLTSGMSVGRTCPFVHIACIFANQYMTFPFFKSVHEHHGRLKTQILIAAAASGLAAAFGTPYGGVIFAIELSCSYFQVNNLWRTYLCSFMCILIYTTVDSFTSFHAFNRTYFPKYEVDRSIFIYLLAGVICGFLSVFFVYCVNFLFMFRKKVLKIVKWKGQNYIECCFVAALTAVFAYYYPIFRRPDSVLINEFFSNETLSHFSTITWKEHNTIPKITFYIIIKFSLTVAAIGLPIPCGLFVPLLAIGAGIGRLIGEIFQSYQNDVPGAFAVVSAAAFASGCTQTIAPGIIILELTGQNNELFPVLLAVLVSYTIAETVTKSVFDVLIYFKEDPCLPLIPAEYLVNYTVGKVQSRPDNFLTLKSTYAEADILLKYLKPNITGIPIVTNEQDMILIGSVSVNSLKYMVEAIKMQDFEFTVSEMPWILNYFKPLKNIYLKQSELFQYDRYVKENFVTINDKIALPCPIGYSLRTPLAVDISPYTVYAVAPLLKVYFMFSSDFCSRLYVTEQGKLIGEVDKANLFKFIKEELKDVA